MEWNFGLKSQLNIGLELNIRSPAVQARPGPLFYISISHEGLQEITKQCFESNFIVHDVIHDQDSYNWTLLGLTHTQISKGAFI